MKYALLFLLYGTLSLTAAAQQGIVRQVNMVTNAENADAGLKANAYPNPVTSSLNIDLLLNKPAMVRLKVTDLIGKQIYMTELQQYEAGNHSLNIPMATASPGVYFFNVIDETGSTTASGRFVKQ